MHHLDCYNKVPNYLSVYRCSLSILFSVNILSFSFEHFLIIFAVYDNYVVYKLSNKGKV